MVESRCCGVRGTEQAYLLDLGLPGDEQALKRREFRGPQLREPPQQPDQHPVGELVVVRPAGELSRDRARIRRRRAGP